MKATTGIIQGNTIRLNDDVDLPDGVQVEVWIRSSSTKGAWGEGLQRGAGALAADWSDEDDRILKAIEQERDTATHRALPE